MQTLARLCLLVAAVTTAGCHNPSSPDLMPFKDLRIEARPSAMGPGDTARVLFRNAGLADLYVNSCGSRLERETRSNTWQEVSSSFSPNCADLLLVLSGG